MDNSEQEIHHEENQPNEIQNEVEENRDINNHIEEENSTSKKIQIGHELSSEDNKKYFLLFIPQKDLLKILLTEKDIFPYKTYELLISLEELRPKNDFFLQFSSLQDLSSELNSSNTTISFKIYKQKTNVIELAFVFPDEEEEVELIANEITDREIFGQLFEKYKSIKQEQEEDINQLKNRMNHIEEILVKMQKEQEEEKEKERLEKERIEQEKLEQERLEKENEQKKMEEEIKEKEKQEEIQKNKKSGKNTVKSKKTGKKK